MTIWKDAIKRTVDEALEDVNALEIVRGHQVIMNSGQWDKALMQFGCRWRGEYSLYDAYASIYLSAWRNCCKLGSMYIEVKEPPKRDCDVEGNNKILKENLPSSFFGKFWGGTKDEDGTLYTDDTQALLSYWDGKQSALFPIEWNSFPLEVGYQPITKTFFQLKKYGRIALYPYGNTKIFIHQYDEYWTKIEYASQDELGKWWGGYEGITHDTRIFD